MKKIALLSMFAYSVALSAQPRGGKPVAPLTINNDQSVTVRYQAPASVKEVKICGDFLPFKVVSTEKWGDREEFTPIVMTKNAGGVWEYTSAALKPDLYKYWFEVDGVKTIDINNLYVMRGGRSDNANFFIINSGVSANYITQQVPHGTVSARWYYSPYFKKDRRMFVYTPAGYEQQPTQRYPVLYIFHGSSEEESSWLTQGRMVEIMDNLIAQGLCKPMIVVAPNGDLDSQASYYTMNFDSSNQPHMCDVQNRSRGKENFDYYEYEHSFKDVINFVDGNYRTIPTKQGRAVCGVSMGGRNAMNVSRIQRNTFDYVGLFSPALEPEIHFPNKGYDQEIIESLRQQAQDGVKLYWIGVGQHDLQWKTNVPFRKILDEVGMKYVFNPSDGAHTYNNWRVYLTKFVPQLFK